MIRSYEKQRIEKNSLVDQKQINQPTKLTRLLHKKHLL